ncbi:hypothetical protein [Candidatus Amarolinea dominans]|uniref:hypothetical protein n=1 Tax=Candidatus Amarolinea dominans TaxID=3140696 RepID=UPI0031CCAE30
MADLIEVLKSVADIVIFDSPPALAVTDSAVLARQLDGVLLVIDSGETREPLARRAIQELTKAGAHPGRGAQPPQPDQPDGYYYYHTITTTVILTRATARSNHATRTVPE